MKKKKKEHFDVRRFVFFSEPAAVENSTVVVCFLTQKYQDSKHCKGELKYAKKKNKPIIPCLINSNWRPSGWLDMDIGDSPYVTFGKVTDDNYDPKCEELLERIRGVAKTDDYFISTYPTNLRVKHFSIVLQLKMRQRP